MVPKGWKLVTVGSLFDVQLGKMLNQAAKDKNPQFPYIGNSDVRWGSINLTNLKEMYFSEKEQTKFSLQKGDILMCEGGEVGRCAIWNAEPTSIFYQKALHRLRTQGRILPEYFQLYMLSLKGTKLLDDFTSRTSIAHLTREKLLELPVKTPPLKEQRKIAQILSTWDKAITATEKLVETSKQQKKALMQQLLTGKKRLVNSETGKAFEGEWTFKAIEEISTRIKRKSDGEKHPILTISSLSGFVKQEDKYSRFMAGESVKNYILLKQGEFAYNKGNSKTYQFGCVFDLEDYESGLVPHVYVCFALNRGLYHKYFKYLFEADYLKPQLGALVNTGVRNNGLLNIKPSEFMKTRVPVPCIEEQKKIAGLLAVSSKEIEHLEIKLTQLKEEKKALMQQLLTGKRRVQVEEAQA